MSGESPRGERRWLNRTVLGIGLASLFSDVGHEMATTAMPALLASLGAGSGVLGVIEGLADGISSFAKLAAGVWSDRLRRRKPLAILGYLATASGMASFALATQWWHVLLGRVGGWLGRGARTPVRNVLLAEATTPESYGRAFGLERAMDSAGAVIGPALSLLIAATLGLRALFALTLVPGLIAALLIAALVREAPRTPKPGGALLRGFPELPAQYRKYLLGVGIAGLGDFSNTLLILWATEAWTPRLGAPRAATLAMLFYVGYNVIYTVSCYLSGHLADRLSRRFLLAGGYALGCVPAAALLLPGDSLVKFAVVFGFSGLYRGVWETVETATAAALLPETVRGAGFGLLATVNGVGDLAASAIVGVLWTVSPAAAMSFVIGTSLAGAAIIMATRVD